MENPRLKNLRKELRSADLDALALNVGPSLAYLTGLHFHLSERPIVGLFTAAYPPALILPELELLQVANLPYEIKTFPFPENPAAWDGVFGKAISSLGLAGKRIGVEPLAMRLLEFHHLQAGGRGADFPDAGEVIGRLRVKKDAAEAAIMRRAVNIAQEALRATIPLIKIGMSEMEIAAELTIQLLRRGADADLSSPPIVSSGPNSANPHATPSERKIQHGDLLVVDWGARVEGYLSDLTRTFTVDEATAEWKKIHQIVLAANAAGKAAAQPGVPCSAIDKAARQVIEQAGYGPQFTHRTGHGIGLEVHEAPYLRGDNDQLLEPGMAFTVEPGIYLAGRNGVRIEDNMLITTTGAECLSGMNRDLLVVG